MNMQLIKAMQKETERSLAIDKEHQQHHSDKRFLVPKANNVVHCLKADRFIHDRSLFMSFHQAESNQFRHYHDFFEINYVVKGNPIAIIDDQPQQLQAGSLCIMNPKAVHYFQSYTNKKDLILNIVLPTELLKKSLFLPMLSDPVLNRFFIRYSLENSKKLSFIYFENPDSHIDSIMTMLTKEYLSPKNYTQTVTDALITLLFTHIFRDYRGVSKSSHNNISHIIDDIYQNYQDCTLEHLAAKYNYHPKYLSKLIHNHSGYTLRELISNIRLKNGEQYLLYTDLSIEAIAAAVGYCDKSSFYNSFRKSHQMTPHAFRKMHR